MELIWLVSRGRLEISHCQLGVEQRPRYTAMHIACRSIRTLFRSIVMEFFLFSLHHKPNSN